MYQDACANEETRTRPSTRGVSHHLPPFSSLHGCPTVKSTVGHLGDALIDPTF